ncbi:MAG: glycosyltransferase family 39 protein, partial [Deltaproteobacteria bacterium]|nr:glycosyltransferase family 39 protein [Deltaproteobacteria bacterium]
MSATTVRPDLLLRPAQTLAWVLLTAAIVIVYRRIFGVYFLNEDFIWLRVCRFLPGRGLWTLLTHDVMVGRYSWRPLVQVSFAVNQWLGGLNPFGYRFEVLLWQVISAFVLYGIVCRVGDAPRALVAALLFAVHPLQVESLAWTCARGGPISTAFLLLAVLAYLRWRRGGHAVWVAMPFGFAMATQENSVVLF